MFSVKKIFVFLLISVSLFAADFSVNGNFRGIFDNLENMHGKEESGTVFGTSSDLSLGFLPDENNQVLLGVHLFQTFGDKQNQRFQPLVSYKFQNEAKTFLFGSTQRINFIDYHDYILSRRWQFENPVFEGVYFQRRHSPALQWTVWVDWVGFQSRDTRERFLLGNDFDYFLQAGERGTFNFGWQFLYDHIASRDRDYYHDPVEDIGAFVGKIAYELDDFRNPVVKSVETAVRGMLTYNRQRQFTSNYYTKFGVEPSVKINFNRGSLAYSHFFRIYENAPFYYNLETGDDRFFADLGQLDIFARLLDSDFANIDFTLSFIFTEGGVNNRQTMQAVVPINKIFSRRRD